MKAGIQWRELVGKHTAGPWVLHNPDCVTLAVNYGENELHSWPTNYTPTDLADAKLIASAPTLLAENERLANQAAQLREALAGVTEENEALREACKDVLEMLESPAFTAWIKGFQTDDNLWAMSAAMRQRQDTLRQALKGGAS